MRKEPALLWNISDAAAADKKHTQSQQHTQCERPMAHSVGFNIPAAKCDCTAKQTMQHTKTHTRENEEKENAAGCLLLYMCVCVPLSGASSACVRYEIWGLQMADSREWNFLTPSHQKLTVMFSGV